MLGLAWIDISTGEFSSLEASATSLPDHLARINPREVVLDDSVRDEATSSVKRALVEENAIISYVKRLTSNNISGVIPDIQNPILIENSDGFSEKEGEAIALLTKYLRDHLLEHTPKSLRHSRDDLDERLQIDAHTLKALEIKENLADGGTYGSLMSTIKRTVTSSGTRLLSRWLCTPHSYRNAPRSSLTNCLRLTKYFARRPDSTSGSC